MVWQLFCCVAFVWSVVGCMELGDCNLPLGMESREITDEALTASSSFDDNSVGPQNSRIRTEQNGGAWCPKHQIRADVIEWLQVDLGPSRIVTAIETQGRYGQGLGQEYATAYTVEYWRPDLTGWRRYKGLDKGEILPANNDTVTPVLRKLDSPLVASKVRIVPKSEHTRTICLRLELYGCSFADPLRSYSAPSGSDKRWTDISYDGHLLPNGTVFGGLGQLYDGIIGTEHVIDQPYPWVGWRRSIQGRWVEISFTFNSFRNFSSMAVHVAVVKRKMIDAFALAHLHFGADREEALRKERVEYAFTENVAPKGARWISVPVDNKIARCVVVKLLLRSEWLLVSEFKFDSTPARLFSTSKGQHRSSSVAILTYDIVPNDYVALVIGVILVTVGLGAVILAVRVTRQRHCVIGKGPKSHVPFYAYDCLAPTANPIFTKTVLASRDGTTVSKIVDKAGDRQASLTGDKSTLDEGEYSEYADPDMASSPTLPLIPPPPVGLWHSGFGSMVIDSIESKEADDARLRLADSLYYASSEVTSSDEDKERQEEKINLQKTVLDKLNCPQIDASHLELIDKLGQGEFSQVNLCRLKLTGCQVAVKTKRYTGDDGDLAEFHKELQLLAKMDHKNIIKLLGVSNLGDCNLALIFEHMTNGDLNQYLRLHNNNLSFTTLLRFASQIADAMLYLESMHFVHRDLATRNCLLSKDLTICIGDFGMARSLYQNDYYRIEGRFVLPIRWMAWECVLLGKFSSKTDVWAYGVTLWELFSLAAEQPYALYNDQQVIENLQHMYYNQSLLVYLPSPKQCPPLLYALMMSCWQKEEEQRPSFGEIRNLLQEVVSCA